MMSAMPVKKPNPFLVTAVVSMATFMEVLDTTIANVALNSIAGSLSAGSEESTWVLTSYLVSNGIVLPLSGWLSNVMGRKNFFIFCIAGFTLTSFLCGISISLPMLIICRLLQGLAGGGLQPTQQAIIKDTFPPEKLGMAFAMTGITIVVAPILGPVLGGYITDNFSWRWIFFMNVPIGMIVACLVKKVVVEPPVKKKAKLSIDYIGLGLVALGLGALQIVLDKGQQEDWFDSAFIVTLTVVSVLAIAGAVFWLLRQTHPIVNLRLLYKPSFSMSCIMIFFVGFALYGSTALLPMLLQMHYGYTATLSGMVLSPSGVTTIFLMPVIGRLVMMIQARYLISFGMFLIAGGMWATSLLTPQMDYGAFVFVRILQTAGLPFLFVPVTTLAFSKIKGAASNDASAVISLMRNLGGSFGIAIVASYLARCRQIEQANLAGHLTTDDAGYRAMLAQYTQSITDLGIPAAQAAQSALGKIYQELILQAGILAFRDVYQMIAALMVFLGIVSLFMPNNIEPKQETTATPACKTE